MDKKTIEKDIKTFKALEILSESDGGKILIETMYKDSVNIIDTLAARFSTLQHTEFIALCSSLNEKLNMIRVLSKAKTNAEMAEDALKTIIEKEKEEDPS